MCFADGSDCWLVIFAYNWLISVRSTATCQTFAVHVLYYSAPAHLDTDLARSRLSYCITVLCVWVSSRSKILERRWGVWGEDAQAEQFCLSDGQVGHGGRQNPLHTKWRRPVLQVHQNVPLPDKVAHIFSRHVSRPVGKLCQWHLGFSVAHTWNYNH